MEGLVVDPPFPVNQARLLTHIEWLRTSDVNPPDWDNYDQYRRVKLRWMGNDMCYNMAAMLRLDGI